MPHCKRLLYVTCSEIDRNTGAAVNEEESIRALVQSKAGFTVKAIAPYRSNPQVASDLPADVLIRVQGHGGSLWGFARSWLRMLLAIVRTIKGDRPDLVVYRLNLFPLTEAVVYLWTKQRFAVKTWKDPSEFFLRRWGPLGRMANAVSYRLQRYVLRRAIAVDVQSQAWADWLQQLHGILPERIHVIPNGANGEHFLKPEGYSSSQQAAGKPQADTPPTSAISTENKVELVFAGGFRSVYEHEALVEAVAQLTDDERQSLLITMAGQGKEVPELQQLIHQHGVTDCFTFLGWVAYDELPKLFWQADWGIDLSAVPISRDNPQRTFISQKTAQYLYASLPVIAWDIDGAEFLKEHSFGLLAQYRSIDSLTQVLRTAIDWSRSGQAQKQGRLGSEFASAHRSQLAMAQRRCQLYRSLLQA